MTGNKISQDAKKRLATMCETNDGFRIAEVDLELRGPGDIMGTQQSGLLDLQIADLSKDGQLVVLARQVAMEILQHDPGLERPDHAGIRTTLKRQLKSKPNWSKIS
jgi:ATP-dependent DNA helicase RecG